MKVYMIQGVSSTPLYKVVDNRLTHCWSVITLHKVFLTKRQAEAFREEVIQEQLIDCPTIIEIEVEPIDE
jgi:hypothetical protein